MTPRLRSLTKWIYALGNVVSSGGVILDRCPSWLNLREMIVPAIPDAWVADLIH